MKRITSLILASVLLFSLCACSQTHKKEYSFFAMNTLMTVSFYSAESNTDELETEIEAITKDVESKLSATDESSEVFAFNNRKNEKPFKISETLKKAVIKAEKGYELTNGAFDITVMPVLEKWGFDNGLYGVPKKSEIENALKYVNAEKLSLKNNTLTAPAGVKISLGGIAKGFLGDELLKLLQNKNVSGVLSLGGNIVTVGEKNDSSLWKIGVRDPLDETKQLCTVSVKGGFSVVTSGSYERFFEFEGKKYHHIIDTETGYPADNGTLSVTIIGRDGALCDALSTGLFTMGKEKAVELMKTLNDFDYIIVSDGKTIYTSLDETLFKSENNEYTVVFQ